MFRGLFACVGNQIGSQVSSGVKGEDRWGMKGRDISPLRRLDVHTTEGVLNLIAQHS